MQNAKKGELLSTNAKIAKKKVKVDMCKCVRLYIFSKNRFEKSHSQVENLNLFEFWRKKSTKEIPFLARKSFSYENSIDIFEFSRQKSPKNS